MALKDDLIQKALYRPKIKSSTSKSQYSHFKIYQLPPAESDTNQTQIEHETEHKLETNQTQTIDKLDTNSSTNSPQSEHKKITIFENRAQTEHTTGHIKVHNSITKRIQTEYESDTKNNFPSFVGIQREILIFFYLDSKKQGNKTTTELTLEHIANTLKIRLGSVKTSIKRLEEKHVIKRVSYKNGRGGWSQYKLENHIYHELVQYENGHKLDTNRTQKGYKPDTQPDTQPDTKAPSSSSDLNINKNTTTTELPPEWEEVDLGELQKRNIRFGRNHLIQLWPQLQQHTAFEFQDSINGFIYDLDNGHFKPKSAPLNFLLGVLQKGALYNPSDSYISPEKQRINAMLAATEKRKQDRFLIWVEENEQKIAEWLDKSQGSSLLIDFRVRGKDSLEFIKKQLYEAGKI